MFNIYTEIDNEKILICSNSDMTEAYLMFEMYSKQFDNVSIEQYQWEPEWKAED